MHQPPSRPSFSNYEDPAVRVKAHKLSADDIKTWVVSELDKKGKKKKGTLGIGNGSLFFASESDKVRTHRELIGQRAYRDISYRLLCRNGKRAMSQMSSATSQSMFV